MPPDKFVLLHGFTGCPASWRVVRSHLPAGTRAFCPPLSGHARGPALAPDFVSEVDHLAELIHSRGWTGAQLCGYSLGGRVALGLLARHAHLFQSATIVSAHPGLPENSPARVDRAAADERWASLAERVGTRAFLSQWTAQPLFASQKGLSPRARVPRARVGGALLAGSMRALSLACMPDWNAALSTLGPTRTLYGRRI